MNAAAKEQALSEETYDALVSARKLIEEEQYTQAKKIVDELLSSNQTSYDRAITLQTTGYIYVGLKNNKDAILNFTQALETGELPIQTSHQVEYILAQLLAAESRYKDAEIHLENWLKTESNPDPEAMKLAAGIYYQNGKMQETVNILQKLVRQNSSLDSSINEMLLYGYLQLKDYKSAVGVLEQLTKIKPDNKQYWLQLAAVHQQLKQYKKALAYYELAYNRDYLDTQGILQLANLYLQQGLPYQAGKLLNSEMQQGKIEKSEKNLELLAHCWLQAREYNHATDTLRSLADLTSSPDVYYQLGRIYYQQEKWQEVFNNMERALKHNDKEKQSIAALLMGIAAYRLDDFSRAAKAFNQAMNNQTTQSQARWWLDKIDKTLKKTSG